jgi:hypothetical protein
MLRALSLYDCKNMLRYYNISLPNNIKKIRTKAIDLLAHRMCNCYSENKQLHYILYKSLKNSKNKNTTHLTRKNLNRNLFFHRV